MSHCYDEEQNLQHSLKGAACPGPHLTLQSNLPPLWSLLSDLQPHQSPSSYSNTACSYPIEGFSYFVLTIRIPLSSFLIQPHLHNPYLLFLFQHKCDFLRNLSLPHKTTQVLLSCYATLLFSFKPLFIVNKLMFV